MRALYKVPVSGLISTSRGAGIRFVYIFLAELLGACVRNALEPSIAASVWAAPMLTMEMENKCS